MYGIIFLFMAMFCHGSHQHTGKCKHSTSQVTTLDDEGGGDSGDTGQVPPKPPTPPTPPNP